MNISREQHVIETQRQEIERLQILLQKEQEEKKNIVSEFEFIIQENVNRIVSPIEEKLRNILVAVLNFQRHLLPSIKVNPPFFTKGDININL